MLLVPIDRASTTPVFRQICDRIAEMVEEGTLGPGDRIPPTRVLAHRLAVHRSTVVRAFDELRALGYIEATAGSYTTVRRRTRWPRARVQNDAHPAGPGLDWDSRTATGARAVLGHPAMELSRDTVDHNAIDFEHLSADPKLAPTEEMRRCLKQTLLQGGNRALDYSDPAGWHPLRQVIATRLGHHGIAVSPEEVLITGGAQQALDLILRLLTERGDRVVVESPTYGMAHALFRLHGVQPLEIPMTREGMDLSRLEGVLSRERPRFVFTMPNFQNPTGITTSQLHREHLLTACERHGVPIVEDGFEEEMKYFGQAVLPVKSMDVNGIVLYVGTFSKVVFPGLRLGWIAASRSVIDALTQILHASCLCGNSLSQAAAARFVAGGAYELYLRRVHRVYRKRMQTMMAALESHLPEECQWPVPEGGYTAWLSAPGAQWSEAEISAALARAGVLAAEGRRFFLSPPQAPHFRLSISQTDEEQIEEGCRRLGRVFREAVGGRDRGRLRNLLGRRSSSAWGSSQRHP